MNKKNFNVFPLYHSDKNKKGKLFYISSKFLCLCLYFIGFYYVLLSNSLENSSLEVVKNCNIYKRNLVQVEKSNKGPKRKKNLKNKKDDIDQTKANVNDLICNEPNVEKNKDSINNDLEKSNIENESNNSISNINYNDISKQLTRQELFDVLDSFKECPPRQDLLNLWGHALGVNKEGLNVLLKKLLKHFPKNSIDHTFSIDEDSDESYTTIWFSCVHEFGKQTSISEIKFTNKFHELINNKSSIVDIRNFIFSCLEEFEQMYKEIYKEYERNITSFKTKM
ncbi:Plasmodium exported protein (PHISTa-like), putative [Plasmodium sp. gorilla clade G1]|nr:Plasmodium exported protein (PHISTa-like), putative [Plasmodium sp. gorilla clade G1]